MEEQTSTTERSDPMESRFGNAVSLDYFPDVVEVKEGMTFAAANSNKMYHIESVDEENDEVAVRVEKEDQFNQEMHLNKTGVEAACRGGNLVAIGN